MAPPSPSDPKSALRRHLRSLVPNPPPAADALVPALDRWLREHPEVGTLAAFAALPGEADLLPLLERHPERHWVFPRIVGEHLAFHRVQDPARDLRPGAFGVREPLTTLATIPLGEIDAFLCPGLAFDAAGGRLGRGRGYYDRTLAAARPDAWNVGIAFEHQLVDRVPTADHDVRMDLVLSPAGALRVGTRESA